MTKSEISNLLEYLSEFFPRVQQSEVVMEKWFHVFGHLPYQQVKRAVDRHIENSEKAPTIAAIKGCFESIFGAGRRESRPSDIQETSQKIKIGASEWLPKTKMEICLDHLPLELINEELKKIVGDPATIRWYDLVKSKDWVPAYQRKLEDLYQLAVHNYGAPECLDVRGNFNL